MLSEQSGFCRRNGISLPGPSRLWWKDYMKSIMKCCIIMHNMMVEYREDGQEEYVDISDGEESEQVVVRSQVGPMWISACNEGVTVPPAGSIGATCILQRLAVNDSEYYNTRYLSMEHLWKVHGSGSLPD